MARCSWDVGFAHTSGFKASSRHRLGFCPYALMDFVVDQYFPILEALEEKVVELEEVVLDEKFIHETTSRIYHLKRELLSIKRAVWPFLYL